MADYISREAAIAAAERYGLGNGCALGAHSGIADCIAAAIERIPAADVEPVRHGRWIPCSERFPELFENKLGIEYSETVFALTDGRKIMAAFMRRIPGDKAIWIAPFNFWEAWDEKITHWTEFPPLPEPPEEGGNEE